MEDWKFTQQDPSEALARLHFFSVKKKHAEGAVEVRITVKEFATAKTADMKFYASADRELNQKTLPFEPCGWGESLQCAHRVLEKPAQIRIRSPRPARGVVSGFGGA